MPGQPGALRRPPPVFSPPANAAPGRPSRRRGPRRPPDAAPARPTRRRGRPV